MNQGVNYPQRSSPESYTAKQRACDMWRQFTNDARNMHNWSPQENPLTWVFPEHIELLLLSPYDRYAHKRSSLDLLEILSLI